MWKIRSVLWLAIAAMAGQPAFAQPPAGSEKLPEGARLRLGNAALGTGDFASGGALSPDGKYLVIAGQNALTLYDRGTGKQLARISANGATLHPALVLFAPDGKSVFYASFRGVIQTAIPAGTVVRPFAVNDPTFTQGQGLCVSADGKTVAIGTRLATGKRKAKAFVWDVTTGKSIGEYEAMQNASCSTALAPDGKVVATWGRHFARMVGEDQTAGQVVQLWDVATGKELRRLKTDLANGQVQAAAFAPDGKTLGIASGGSTFYVFDAVSGKELRRFAGRRSQLALLQFSPDGQLLVAGSLDGMVQAWQAATGKRVTLRAGPRAQLLSIAFPGNGQIMALGMVGQCVRWWDAVTGESSARSPGHEAPILSLAYSPDGKTLVSISSDSTALRWDAATGKLLRTLSLVDDTMWTPGSIRTTPPVGSLALSPDGQFAATKNMYSGNSVRLWDLASGQIVCDFEVEMRGNGMGLAFGPHGKRLAATLTSSVQIWDAESGQEAGKLAFQPPGRAGVGLAPRIAFAPDGKAVAVLLGYFDPTTGIPGSKVLVLDAASGKERFELPIVANSGALNFGNQASPGAELAFSPDGKLLAVPGPDQSVVIVRADTGKEWKRLAATGIGAATALAFAPDSRALAVAHGGQRTATAQGLVTVTPTAVGVWEVASGWQRAKFRGQRGGVSAVVFSPDGRTLASAGADTTVILWNVWATTTPKPSGQTAGELDAHWAVLGKADAAVAFQAQRRLIAAPAETVAFLKAQLAPAKAAPLAPGQLAKWIASLDSEDFTTRDTAYHALETLGPAAEPALRKARTANTPLEMRRRIDDLLQKIERGKLTPPELQATRAVEILERIATPAARALVAAWAEGDAAAVLTREARAALGRMRN